MSYPFETTKAGNYRVIEPLDGTVPEELSLTINGTTYTLTGYVGKDTTSKVHPDVLAYEHLDVEG